MGGLSFDSFIKKIYLNAPMEKIYWCWGTPEGICTWFLRKAEYLNSKGILRNDAEQVQAGDSYTWEWHNWDGQETGMVLKANGKDYFEISFAGNTRVAVSLEAKDDAVLLTLKQFEIPVDDDSKLKIHYGCSNGWTFWLANLKAYLEHGILLNETKHNLSNEPLAGYEYVNM